MEERLQIESPASLVLRAQEALSTIEREETDVRQRLTLLEAQEEQLCAEVRRGMERAAMVPDTIETTRTRLENLSREREALARERADQWKVLREIRERLHSARRSYEDLRRHAVELQHAIRREERAVAQWLRQIKETEEKLGRWQRLLGESQARLEQARREIQRLTGFQQSLAFADARDAAELAP